MRTSESRWLDSTPARDKFRPHAPGMVGSCAGELVTCTAPNSNPRVRGNARERDPSRCGPTLATEGGRSRAEGSARHHTLSLLLDAQVSLPSDGILPPPPPLPQPTHNTVGYEPPTAPHQTCTPPALATQTLEVFVSGGRGRSVSRAVRESPAGCTWETRCVCVTQCTLLG